VSLVREADVEIVNRLGLHARAAARLIAVASGFGARIRIHHGNVEADAKSIMKVLQLAAPLGSRLRIVAEGDDAEAAVAALCRLIADRFGEEA
jgi:phosphocarrier protein HPr